MTTNTDVAMPELLPCPFCGGKAAVVPRAVNIALQKDPSDPKFGVSIICAQCSSETANMVDEAHAAAKWNRRAAIQQAAGAVPKMPTVPDNMQDWAGMDGTTAWHLIERHADNWADIGKMMDEWLAANSQQPVHLGGGEVGGVPLTTLAELGKRYSLDFASPHHMTFSLEGLRHLIEAVATAGQGMEGGV